MKYTILIFFLFIATFASADQNLTPSPSLAPQGPFATKEAQLNVIINGNRASRKSREMYLILKTLQQSQTDYLENPEKFKVLESFTSGEPPRQMTQDEVALMYFSKLVADEQISYTIQPPDWFEAAKHLVPSLGLDITPLNPIFDGLTLHGNPPLTWEMETQVMNPGALLVSLDGQPGQLGTLARDSFKNLFEYDLNENLLMTKELGQAEFIYEQSQNDTLLLNEMGKLNKQVEEFNRQQLKWNQQLQAAKTQEEKAAIQRKEKIDLEMRRNEIRGGLQMTSTVLQLTGNPKAAQAVSGVSQLAEITFTLLDGTTAAGVPLGPLATANLYVAGAAVLVSMLSSSKGKSEMEAIMEQLQAILDLLNDTRKEMHERFDLVDMKLDYLIYRIDSGLHALQNSTERIEENLANIQIAIDDLRASNQQFVLDLYKRLVLDDIRVCLPREGFSPPVSFENFNKCFSILDNNLYTNSFYFHDSLSQGDQNIENVTLDIFSFPYVSALPRLIQKLRNEYNLPIVNESQIVNAYVWNEYIQKFMLLWTAHPQYSSQYGNIEIQKALNKAEEIQEFYGSLVLIDNGADKKVINIPLFEKLKENYQNLLASTVEWMDAAARNNNELGINPSLVQSVKNQDLPRISGEKQEEISACSGQTQFGVVQIIGNGFVASHELGKYRIPPVNRDWNNFRLLKEVKGIPPSNLAMWPSAFYSLPNQFLNHEKRFPGSVNICFRQFIFNSWVQDKDTSTADFTIILETQLSGATVATANIHQKIVFNGVNEVAKQFNLLNRTQYYAGHTHDAAWNYAKYMELYRIYWNKNSAESKLPTNGILASNFSDITKWELHFNLELMQKQAQERIQNDPDYKVRKTQLNETRNMMRILLQIGLSDAAPNKFEAQSLLRETYGIVPKGLRSLDAVTDQYLTGYFTEKEILAQTNLAGSALIELLKNMNASQVPLEPRNAAIDTSIDYLRTLLVF